MNAPSDFNFQWFSPLGTSVALFLLYGGFYVFIGTLAPIMMNAGMAQQVTISSADKDNALFGGPLPSLLQTSPALAKMRTMLLTMTCGLLDAAGIVVLAVTWFGFRQGQTWALQPVTLMLMAAMAYEDGKSRQAEALVGMAKIQKEPASA